ncbi:ExbD/TolR family protein [Rhodosalinus sediminis]|uniref:ExbD/TolR family protein n=1 Tax=Rhodosalinus sediminis TaxID=1940533 RepID=UPI002352DA14|nr:biopolymer transporter ExbD [Rhodosalinus sediminis]
MRRARRKPAREPTIALINIVFLMLVFFLVAGTVAQPLDREVRLVRTEGLDGAAPPDALVLHADGRMTRAGAPVETPEAALAAEGGAVRLVPDRDLPAARLVEVAGALRAAGAERVLVVTERGMQ